MLCLGSCDEDVHLKLFSIEASGALLRIWGLS